MKLTTEEKQWADQVIRNDEITRYLNNGKDFIDEELIWNSLEKAQNPAKSQIRDIVQKSLELNRLDPIETAALLNCKDEDLWQEMYAAGLKIKQAVYGRRIVIFAPLYISDYCVNNCVYCGFRASNKEVRRKQLSQEELREEIRHW